MKNVQNYIIIIAISILIGAGITYGLTNKTIEQQLEEQNTAILQDCLSKARVKEVPSEILESASHCNKDLLKTIYSPLYSRTGATMNATGSKVSEPLGFQIIPQASANDILVEQKPVKNVKNTILNENIAPVRTPKQIYEQVKHLGYREAPTISLISTCKASSGDPRHCILIGLVLLYNESGNQQKSIACVDRNNCFGIQSGKKSYTSLDEGMENWVQKYNKYWYKAYNAKYFYPDLGEVSPTKYCTTEKQHEPNIGCPDGQKIASSKWKQLYKIIY